MSSANASVRKMIERGRFILKPENKAFPVIRPQGALEIFGIMVGLVRKTAH